MLVHFNGHGVKRIKKLIIEDSIKKIARFAFSRIDIEIDTVYWPKVCKIISLSCFEGSNTRSVVGVEEVEKIEPYAFDESFKKE